MRYSPELSVEAKQFLKTGELFDAAGFSGEGGEFDLSDFVEAASDVIPCRHDSEDYQTYIRASLAGEYRELQRKGYDEGRAASYMLGSVVWRISSHPDNDLSQGELKALLSRSVHNIAQTREVFGRGDEKLFYSAFANYTDSFGQDYPTRTRRSLYQLSRHAEQATYDARRSVVPIIEREKQGITAWGHVLRGMAAIAMIEGYKVQPPPEQTDGNGAWQLPHEKDEEDDV